MVELGTLQDRYRHDPIASALIDRAESILAGGSWNQQSRARLEAEAQRLHLSPDQTQAILNAIAQAASANSSSASVPGASVEGLLDFLQNKSTQPRAAAAEKKPNQDPKISQFLAQATPIIAQERGLTDAAQTRLNRLAYDLHLNDAERDAAIRELTAGPGAGSKAGAKRPRRKLFHEHVERFVTRTGQDSMTFAEERELISAGTNEYGLEVESASALIRSLREKHNLEFISQADAARTVRTLFEQAGVDNLPQKDHNRIKEQGLDLGLTEAQIEELRNECTTRAEQRKQSAANFFAWSRTIAMLGVLGVAACVAGVSLLQVDRPGEIDSPPPLEARSPHPWFTPSVELAVTDAQRKLPQLSDWLTKVRDGTDEERKAAWAELLPKSSLSFAAEAPTQSAILSYTNEDLETVSDVLAGLMATEPSFESAKDLIDRVASLMESPRDDLLTSSRSYQIREWALDALLRALVDPDITFANRTEALRRLNVEVGYAFKPDEPLPTIAEKCRDSVKEKNLLAMQLLASQSVADLWRIYEAVFGSVVDQNFSDPVENARTTMLCTYLESSTPDSEKWLPFLKHMASRADDTSARQIEDSLAKCNNSVLVTLLTAILSSRPNS